MSNEKVHLIHKDGYFYKAPNPDRHQYYPYRSEERRVGKECRSRWSPYH